MKIILRADAIARGLSTYFTGVACVNGHVSVRYVAGSVCQGCAADRYAVAKATNPELKRTRAREDYQRNKEAVDARHRATYAKNSAAIIAQKLAWRKTPEGKAYLARYNAENAEMIAATRAAWAQRNRERLIVQAHNRRAQRREAGSLSPGLAKKLYVLQRGSCANCRCKLPKRGYHLDHIVPVFLGGANVDSNIQLLCAPCNRRKSTKDPISWAQEHGRLL